MDDGIYGELNETFHVGLYSGIPDARRQEVSAWFAQRTVLSL